MQKRFAADPIATAVLPMLRDEDFSDRCSTSRRSERNGERRGSELAAASTFEQSRRSIRAARGRSTTARSSVADGELLVLVGPVGLRQVDGAAAARRPRGADRAARSASTAASSTTSPPQERNVAMVFQDYALYPHMTVRENLDVPAAHARLARDDDRDAASRGRPSCSSSERCSTACRASSPAASASASRWGARWCASRPSSCSTSRSRTSTPSCAARCAPRSQTLQRRTGTTMLYVTHDQVEAMTLGDRVAVLHDGPAPAGRDAARALRASRRTSSSRASSALRR